MLTIAPLVERAIRGLRMKLRFSSLLVTMLDPVEVAQAADRVGIAPGYFTHFRVCWPCFGQASPALLMRQLWARVA